MFLLSSTRSYITGNTRSIRVLHKFINLQMLGSCCDRDAYISLPLSKQMIVVCSAQEPLVYITDGALYDYNEQQCLVHKYKYSHVYATFLHDLNIVRPRTCELNVRVKTNICRATNREIIYEYVLFGKTAQYASGLR